MRTVETPSQSRGVAPASRWHAGGRLAALTFALASVGLAGALAQPAAKAEPRALWQIREPGGTATPSADAEFPVWSASDAVFVVGRSDARRDWPRIHPGPQNERAGSRAYRFTVLFAVRRTLPSGSCRLQFKLSGADVRNPPWLVTAVNGEEFFKKKIGRDRVDDPESMAGDGMRPIEFDVEFPAALLRAGVNEITLTTVEGGWMQYESMALEAPAGIELAPVPDMAVVSINSIPGLIERDGRGLQPIEISIFHSGKTGEVLIWLGGEEPRRVEVRPGLHRCEVVVPAVDRKTRLPVVVESGGTTIATQDVTLEPVRKLTVYVLPHSHTDIGFTDIQTAIEKKQVNNLLQAIRYARRTADYPAGARFIWNVEVLWAADLYLNRLSESERAEFFEAVKAGRVALNGMYLNVLTGLCRPEELIQLFRYSGRLAEQCGGRIDSAMISDVPGYTWGTVTAMAQAGIRYFSVAPNFFDRIGDINVRWENKPFYWASPSGRDRVLVWIPYNGYGLANRTLHLTPRFVSRYQGVIENSRYPYDIGYIRWCGHGDNALPDPSICEFVRDWNARYTWPRFIISSTTEAFRALEERHGRQLPEVRGDWTPYWEDGAGSSAAETALNRTSSDALAQAQALWAMFAPSSFPAGDFAQAWNRVLLYSEHTWGANLAISDPDSKKTIEQWTIKQGYALDAFKRAADTLRPRALGLAGPPGRSDDVDIWNSTSWTRSGLIRIERAKGDRVIDDRGEPLASQRSGEALAVWVKDVPPFGARRLRISRGEAFRSGAVTLDATGLDNGVVRLRVDPKTGGIAELRAQGIEENLVDASRGEAVNDYLYLIGNNLADLQRNGPVRISVGERGPLVASLLIESAAPGCRKLIRELRLIAGCDYVEITNTVDKLRLEAANYRANSAKESVNFAFPFNVPRGEMLLDTPLGAFRPEVDQMPSACKNWLTVGRWADISNRDYGITWITLDAPLTEVGGITATMLNSQRNPEVWRHRIDPTQTLYSWVMNNHWGTNYRARQEGVVQFRYVLRPHRRFSPIEAACLATGFSQPLLARAATGSSTPPGSRLRLSPPDVVIAGLKPSDDGRAIIVRLFGASGKDTETRINWSNPEPKRVWLSDTSEKPRKVAPATIAVPGWGMVTIRADFHD